MDPPEKPHSFRRITSNMHQSNVIVNNKELLIYAKQIIEAMQLYQVHVKIY